MKTKISKSSEKYYIIKFDEGPSEDPSYHIFLEESNGENSYIGSVDAEKLIIPGNGYLYSSGETNQEVWAWPKATERQVHWSRHCAMMRGQ